jgi:hypothetical protein
MLILFLQVLLTYPVESHSDLLWSARALNPFPAARQTGLLSSQKMVCFKVLLINGIQLIIKDYLIHTLLDSHPSANYTIIYTTTPASAEIVDDLSYKPVFIEPLHMELKRFDDKPPNDNEKDDRPLFEKYQFFTPGT